MYSGKVFCYIKSLVRDLAILFAPDAHNKYAVIINKLTKGKRVRNVEIGSANYKYRCASFFYY